MTKAPCILLNSIPSHRISKLLFHWNRLWTDPADVMESDIMPKEVFRRISIFRNRLLNYGIEAEPIFPKYCAQNQDECA